MKKRFQALFPPLDGLNLSQRIAVRLFLPLCLNLIRVENEERITPTDEPVIFVFNHNNSLETIILATYLLYKRRGKAVHFVVDWIYGYLPVIGWFVRQVEPIFVYNKKARLGFYNRIKAKVAVGDVWRECAKRLENKHSIAIFPEGCRNSDPHSLKAGRNGIGKIAIESGASIIPVGIEFLRRTRHGKVPPFGSMVLRIGERINFAEEIAAVKKISATGEYSGRLKQKLLFYFDKRVTHAVMLELAALSGKRYPFDPPVRPLQAD